jgi:MATE family multidrug resistance protein
MALFGLCFIIFRNQLPLLYIDDIDVISISASLLIFAALFQIFDGTQAVGLGILRGMVDVKIPMFMAFIAYWMISIPVGYLLGFKLDFGPEGVWIGLSVGLTVAAIFFTARFFRSINKLIDLLATNKD